MVFELKQAAQGTGFFALVVDEFGVLLKSAVVVHPGGILEQVDGLRVEQVLFAFALPLVDPAHRQALHRKIGFAERKIVLG